MDVRASSSTPCAQRAAFLLAHKPADAPFHVGVLLDNVPEFWFALGAAALSGATLVGINPTRRGAELARDIAAHRLRAPRHRDRAPRPARRRGRASSPRDRLFVVDDARSGTRALAPYAGAPLPDVDGRPARHVHADLHVGHHRRAEGRAHEPRPAHRLRARTSPSMFGLGARRRLLLGDAALPLERGGRRASPNVDRVGRDRGAAPPVLGERLPPRRAQVRRHVLQLRRQAAHLHPRDARATRRRRQHVAHRVRQRGRAARHRPLRAPLRLLSSSTATARPRAAST